MRITKIYWLSASLALALAIGLFSGTNLALLRADSSSTPFRDRLEELRKTRGKSLKIDESPARGGFVTDPSAIDEQIANEWRELKLSPTEESTEGEFVRRATLDLIGRIPTLDETQQYLSDRSRDRRAALVARLTADQGFGRHLAHQWIRLLAPRDVADDQNVNREALQAWLEREFNRNRPWNEIVKELITATGRWDENPAVNFILANQDGDNTLRTTSTLTRAFLGVQTQCTECHDHPWNSWKQDQFHGLNAFFVATKEEQSTRPAGGQRRTDYWTLEELPFDEAKSKGVSFERRNGLASYIEPTYLDGRDLAKLTGREVDPEVENLKAILGKGESTAEKPIYLRQELARAVTGPDNPYFARAFVNRAWHQLFGHSFTKGVDDFDNGLDEPTMPDLLDQLAEDFKESGYDVKGLYASIASTRAYALSSRRKSKRDDESIGFFSFQLVKPLSPEQLYDSILTLTAVDRTATSANATAERQRFVQEFSQTFSTEELPTGAPAYDGTITQGLMMMNSSLMERTCACMPGTFLHHVVTNKEWDEKEKVEAIYLAGLSRKPTAGEKKVISERFSRSGGKPETYGDVLWAIINSAEFLLNH